MHYDFDNKLRRKTKPPKFFLYVWTSKTTEIDSEISTHPYKDKSTTCSPSTKCGNLNYHIYEQKSIIFVKSIKYMSVLYFHSLLRYSFFCEFLTGGELCFFKTL